MKTQNILNHEIISIIIIVFILLFFIFTILYTLMFTGRDICEYTLPNGNKVDLSVLKSDNDYSFTKGSMTIKANFCKSLTNPCFSSFNQKSPANVMIGNGIDQCFSLSKGWFDTSISTQPGTDLRISFPSGDKYLMENDNMSNMRYQVDYIFQCETTTNLHFFNVNVKNNCFFNLMFKTKYVCPEFYKKQNNIFSLKYLLLLIIIIFFLYVTVFTIINYKNNPEDGWIKALPHRYFWKEFMNEIIKGVNIAYFKVKRIIKGNNPYDNGYDFCNTDEISNNKNKYLKYYNY